MPSRSSEFLTDVLQSPDPTKDGREIKVVDLLDNAAKKLETDSPTSLINGPTVSALGSTYQALGLYSQPSHFKSSVRDYHLETSGPEDPDTLSAMHRLGNAYQPAIGTDEAIALLEEALKLTQSQRPPTLQTLSL